MMNDESTLGDLQSLMAREGVMRMQVSRARNGVVVLLVWEDGTTVLSSGHPGIADAVVGAMVRKENS